MSAQRPGRLVRVARLVQYHTRSGPSGLRREKDERPDTSLFPALSNSLLHCVNIRRLAPLRSAARIMSTQRDLATVCSRCAARLVQNHTPVNLIVNIIKGSHRRERAVAFTSYCKPEKHLKDRFAAQNPLCSF